MLYIYIITQTDSNIDIDTDIYTYIYIYTRIYISLTILIASEHYTKANKSIVGWLNGLLVSIQNYTLRYAYVKYMQVLQSVPNTKYKDDSS